METPFKFSANVSGAKLPTERYETGTENIYQIYQTQVTIIIINKERKKKTHIMNSLTLVQKKCCPFVYMILHFVFRVQEIL